MKIANWFINKNFNSNERYIAQTTDAVIERETEKAYLLKFKSEFGTMTKWVPKSVCEEDAEPETEKINYEAGMKVEHSKFGKGEIISTEDFGNDKMLVVKFGKNQKTLMANFANLKIA